MQPSTNEQSQLFQVNLKNLFAQGATGQKIHHHYKRGEVLFHEDTPNFGVHIIEHGSVKLYSQGPEGKETITRIAREGDLLGLTSLFSGKRYIESARALESTECSFIEANALKDLIKSEPWLSEYFLSQLSQELSDSHLRQTEMIRKNVRERLASCLLRMGEKYPHHQDGQGISFPLHLNREEIAAYIGSAHETVIRCLSEFKELGYINEKNRIISILNKERLMEMSGILTPGHH